MFFWCYHFVFTQNCFSYFLSMFYCAIKYSRNEKLFGNSRGTMQSARARIWVSCRDLDLRDWVTYLHVLATCRLPVSSLGALPPREELVGNILKILIPWSTMGDAKCWYLGCWAAYTGLHLGPFELILFKKWIKNLSWQLKFTFKC